MVPTTIAVKLPARIHQDEDGSLWADIPAARMRGGGGSDLDEVLANLGEAAEGWILAKHDVETKGWPNVSAVPSQPRATAAPPGERHAAG